MLDIAYIDGINNINASYTGLYKNSSIHYGLQGRGVVEFSKHILTSLYCTKYNEINICHSDIKRKAYFL